MITGKVWVQQIKKWELSLFWLHITNGGPVNEYC